MYTLYIIDIYGKYNIYDKNWYDRIYLANLIKRRQYFLILNEKQCNIYKYRHISTTNNPVNRLGDKIWTTKNDLTFFMHIISFIPN